MFWSLLEALAKDLDVFDEFSNLQRDVGSEFGSCVSGRPAVNIYQNEEGLVVSAELPGVVAEDVRVEVNGTVLTIEAERKPTEIGEEDVWIRRERSRGKARRQVRLPFEVDEGKISARQVNGILTVTLPRAEASRPRTIEVKPS